MRAERSLGHRVRDGPGIGDLTDPIAHRGSAMDVLTFEALFDAIEGDGRRTPMTTWARSPGPASPRSTTASGTDATTTRLLACARVLDPRCLHTHKACRSVVELLDVFADRHGLAAA
jgi:hypothetical protein